jgi:hypothetical protein
MCLEGSYHPLMFHPAYAEIGDLPLAERCAALRSGPIRDRLVNEIPDDNGFFEKVVLGTMWKTWAVAGRDAGSGSGGDIDYEQVAPGSTMPASGCKATVTPPCDGAAPKETRLASRTAVKARRITVTSD